MVDINSPDTIVFNSSLFGDGYNPIKAGRDYFETTENFETTIDEQFGGYPKTVEGVLGVATFKRSYSYNVTKRAMFGFVQHVDRNFTGHYARWGVNPWKQPIANASRELFGNRDFLLEEVDCKQSVL